MFSLLYALRVLNDKITRRNKLPARFGDDVESTTGANKETTTRKEKMKQATTRCIIIGDDIGAQLEEDDPNLKKNYSRPVNKRHVKVNFFFIEREEEDFNNCRLLQSFLPDAVNGV